MPNKNRLLKRQNEYLRASGIYLNPEEDDLFDKEKNDAAAEIRKLNKKLAALTPYNEDGTLKSNDKLSSKLSTEDCDNLMELYQQSIKAMHKLVTSINEHIDTIDKEAEESRDPYFANDYNRERRSCEDMVILYDKITKTMSKDLRALQHVKKKNLSVSLNTVFENSRVNSEYEIVGEIKQSDKGNQNERIPMTIVGKDGNPIKGYFTRDSKPKYGTAYINKAIRDARKKYGKDAKFLSTSAVRSIYYKFVERNEKALDILVSDRYAISMMSYDDAVKFLSENMGSSIKSYIDTPAKLNMFIDVAGNGFSAINQENILEAVGINEEAHVNRRNAAMSKIAELLGCPEVLAESQNIRIKLNGKYVKGTFMKEAKGEDINKIGKKSLMLDSTPLSGLDLNIKKQIAELQIVDYLSGNPDRHNGNMLYYFQKDDQGRAHLKSIQGIDNDSALGSENFDEVGMSSVLLNSMKVIPEEMANKVMNLDPEALKQMLYGFDLTTREINNALGRLTKLQDKIKNDAKEYLKGYTEGCIIPGSIKPVSDKELSAIPLDVLGSGSADENKNQFDTISDAIKSKQNISRYYANAKKNYQKAVYNYTVGSVGMVNSLIDELNKDNRFGGSSTEYNNMLAAMKKLSKSLVSFNGPVCGNNADTKNGHVTTLTELREKIRETLTSVNDYIYYKNSKKKGEEWRDIKGPHESSRTERRYHDAERCCEFLTKQLEKYDELTEKLTAYNEINNTYKKKRDAADINDMKIMKNPDYYRSCKEYNNMLYTNHLSRSKYMIKEAFDKISPANNNPYYTMKYEMLLGYGLFTVKPESKDAFKKDIEDLTGTKITLSDEALLKRAIASDLIITKATCEDKINKAKNDPKLKAVEGVKKLFEDLKHIEIRPFDQAVNNLLNNDTFETFFQSYKEEFHLNNMFQHPGVPTPDSKETAKMIKAYNKALYKKHPELEPAKPNAGQKKITQKKITKSI
ncbi:hypothetical protein SAMN04487934_10822 [Eubacterium ruminantium]|nr:hypothetical protein SAMN04487934_10822 [Eubacterium ruminantium]